MKKTAVIYWSGTGNTKQMAEAVLEGMKNAGAEAVLLEPAQVDASTFSGVDAVAFGCPAMGSEVLEEMEFEPMFSACKNSLGGKKVALFGSFGWGDGEWMRPGKRTATTPGSIWPVTALPVRKRLTTTRWKPAVPWASSWRNKPREYTSIFLSLFPIFPKPYLPISYLSFLSFLFPGDPASLHPCFPARMGPHRKTEKRCHFFHTTAPPGRAALYAFRFRHGSG